MFYKKKLPEKYTKVFEGVIFDTYQWQQTMLDGSTATFEKVVRPDTVTVLAITKTGKILICEQEQPYIGKFVSLPGGVMDGDDVEKEGERELLEETGYKSEKIVRWFESTKINKIDWIVNYLVAYDCEKIVEQNLDKGGEHIVVKEIGFEDFVDLIKEGKLRDTPFMYRILQEYVKTNSFEFLKSKIYE